MFAQWKMEKDNFMENFMYFFLLVYPTANPKKIYKFWEKQKVLKEYPKPEEKELEAMVLRLKSEIRLSIGL